MVFDGKKAASEIKEKLKRRIEKNGLKPSLLIFLDENNEAGQAYVEEKKKVAEKIGVKVKVEKPKSVEQLEKGISEAGEDGVMVQLPCLGLEGEDLSKVLSLIPVEKDVDGLNPETVELIKKGRAKFLPATVSAVEKIIDRALLETDKEMNEEFKIAIVGSEGMVGKPLVERFGYFDFEVGEFEEGDDLGKLVNFIVIISCTGKSNLIEKEMVAEGFVGIDVGYPEGDFAYEQVKERASFITPVPGGVGPLTVACLMSNLIEAASG